MNPLLWQNLLHLWTAIGLGGGILALLHWQERAAGRFVAHRLGWRAVLLTGWLGVPVHELGHLAAAHLFRHRVVSWRLFDPDPVSGTLGFVRHSHDPRSPWQRIGVTVVPLAPLLSGSLVLGLLLLWMLPLAEVQRLGRAALALGRDAELRAFALGAVALLRAFVAALWQHRTPWLPLQLYLGVCVASHLCPSRSDLRGALPGLLLLALITSLGAAAAGQLGHSLGALSGGVLPLAALALLTGALQGIYVGLVGLLGGNTLR